MSTTVKLPEVGQYLDILIGSIGKYKVESVDTLHQRLIISDASGIRGYVVFQENLTGWAISKVQPGQVWEKRDSPGAYVTVVGYSPVTPGAPKGLWHDGDWLVGYECGQSYLPEGMLIRYYTLLDSTPPDLSRFPNTCPDCNSPAYIGFRDVDCSNHSCRHFTKQRPTYAQPHIKFDISKGK